MGVQGACNREVGYLDGSLCDFRVPFMCVPTVRGGGTPRHARRAIVIRDVGDAPPAPEARDGEPSCDFDGHYGGPVGAESV